MRVPIRRGITALRDEGVKSFTARTLRYLGLPAWNTITSRYPSGTNIFEKDWDVLVILDTCRVDTLREVANTKPWIDDVGQIRSVGSMSAEWMLNTFTEEYRNTIGETAFVSGNIWSHRIFNEAFHTHHRHEYDSLHRGWPNWSPVTTDEFAHYETVLPVANQEQQLHPESGAIPQVLTDRAITVARETTFDRLIVHYTLPHLNFIADALDWDPNETSMDELMSGLEVTRGLRSEERSYDPARKGDVDRETVYSAYRQNLRLVLEYVEILLQNIDAENVVISADHGEGFGEQGIWGHPFGWPLAPIKTVPWATTTANDNGTYEPAYDRLERMPDEAETREHLEQMGYL